MNQLTVDSLKNMLRAALAAVTERSDEFSQLDAVIGDGDHGQAIVVAMNAVCESLNNATEFKQLLNDAGFNVMLQTSGSTSTLLGGFLLGMSDQSAGESLDAAGVRQMFAGGLAGVRKNTKAALGDKTMMDTLIPAVEAMETSDSDDIKDLLFVAAEAADKGAKATVEMKANFGRARNYGEKSIGYADSGATSWACMFNAFYQSI